MLDDAVKSLEQRFPSIDNYSMPSNSIINSKEFRLDAAHYSPELFRAIDVLQNSGMQVERLANVVQRVFIPPRFKRNYVEAEHGVPFLQGSHVVHFQPAGLKYLSRHYGNLEQWTIDAGWVLVTRSGTTGRATICPEEWDGWACSEHILRIIPNERKCLSGYLCSFLSSPMGQIQLTANIYGAVVDELTEDQTKDILVPLPKSKEDRELALLVHNSMKKAIAIKSKAVASAESSVKKLESRFKT